MTFGKYNTTNESGVSMSRVADRGERVAAVPVAAGIFVQRYLASDAEKPPRLFVRVSPASENSIGLVFAPGAESGILSAPGSHALIVAERAGRIHLTVVGAPGQHDAAEFKIVPIGRLIEAAANSEDLGGSSGEAVAEPPLPAKRPLARRRARPPAAVGAAHNLFPVGGAVAAGPDLSRKLADRLEISPRRGRAKSGRDGVERATLRDSAVEPEKAMRPVLNSSGFGLICHVARKGDVAVAGGSWIGGPGAPTVIEGVTVHWDAPAGVTLEYQVLVPGAAGRWSAWVLAGEFAGTRGRGLPIVGLRVRVTGDSSKRYRLQGEAIFLGLPAVVESGAEMEFTSYAAVDPLVGLRLDLASSEAPVAAVDEVSGAVAPEKKKAGIGRLRVFKTMRAIDSATRKEC